MRKQILLLLLAVCSLGIFSSCEGPAGRDGFDGNNGLLSVWKIVEFTVENGDWYPHRGESESFFYYDINIPELTQEIASDGAVMVYIIDYDGVNYPLPHEGKYPGYAENIRFNYSRGGVTIEVVPSDQNLSYQPLTYKFKIMLLY